MALYKTLVKKVSISPEKKTKQKDYLPGGQLPIIDQGQQLIGGYSDNLDMQLSCNLPVIVFGDHTRAVKYVDFPFGAGADGIKVLEPAEGIYPKFLYYATQYLVLRLEDRGYARHYQYIEKKELDIPSVPEQKRIVARIEELFSELDNGVETLQKTKQQLAVYRQAVLCDAFSGLDTFTSLQAISERIFDGPFGSNLKTSDYTSSGIRVVRLENLKDGWFDDSKQSFVTKEKYDTITGHTVYPTDLIMSTFIADSIKVCQIPQYVGFAVNKADCVGIRLKSQYLQRYVMYYLMTKIAYNSLVHEVHGATRPRVNTKQIKGIPIPVCDFSCQRQIIATIESRLSVCDTIEKTVDITLQQAEAMRQSILKQAFEGRL